MKKRWYISLILFSSIQAILAVLSLVGFFGFQAEGGATSIKASREEVQSQLERPQAAQNLKATIMGYDTRERDLVSTVHLLQIWVLILGLFCLVAGALGFGMASHYRARPIFQRTATPNGGPGKRTFLMAFGCFLGGLLLGVGGTYFRGMAYWGKQAADGLALIKEMEIAESGQRAFEAYQHESHPVAIYALSQYLNTLEKAEENGGDNPVFMTKAGISFDTMLVHARLAKVYAEAGQPDLSTQHIAEALRRASQDRKLQTITNQATLTEVLARVDKGGTK